MIISVIVPCYNAEPYLEQCLNSLVQQTYTHLEIVCIDDGSTDKTPSILKQFAAQYPDKIHLILNEENQGAAKVRNTGIGHANGSYMTFVDSDDWLVADALETLYLNLKKYDADVSIGGFQHEIEGQPPQGICDTGLKSGLVKKERHQALTRIGAPCPWGKLYKTCFYKAYVQSFPTIEYAEDVLPWVKYWLNADRICYTDKLVYHYRFNPKSITHDTVVAKIDRCMLKNFEMIDDYLQENKPDEAESLFFKIADNLTYLPVSMAQFLYQQQRYKSINLEQHPYFTPKVIEDIFFNYHPVKGFKRAKGLHRIFKKLLIQFSLVKYRYQKA